MKKFLPSILTIIMLCYALAQTVLAQNTPISKPQLDSVSKGTFPEHIYIGWYNYPKKDRNTTFQVRRKYWISGKKWSDWKIVSRNGQQDVECEDREQLSPLVRYQYQVRAGLANTWSDWSNLDYGYIRSTKNIAMPILYEPKGIQELKWSAVQNATHYRLQIIANQRFNHHPVKGFYNVNFLLKDTLLQTTEYFWRGQTPILWSVQALNRQDSSYFTIPLRADSMLQYGHESQSRADSTRLLKWVSLQGDKVSFLVQNTSSVDLSDLNIGIFLSNEANFSIERAKLAGNVPIYLPPRRQEGFSEKIQFKGFQYLYVIPFQSGEIMHQEIESIRIF